MSDDPLKQSIQYVPGVGPHKAELLAKLSLFTVEDVLWFLPREVLDLTCIKQVADLEKDKLQTVRGTVVDIDARSLSQGRTLVAVLLDCDGDYLRGSWFNQIWMRTKFQPGDRVLFSGKPKRKSGRWEIGHPRVQWLNDDDPAAHGGFLPRYRLTEGLSMQAMRQIIARVIQEYLPLLPDHLPAAFREQHRLPALQQAIRQLHAPETAEQYDAGHRRLIFDDLLEFQLGLALRRRLWKTAGHAFRLPTTAKIDARIRRLFPFRFTAGQDQAIREITGDIAIATAMHRLLQADVGAGKTVVAIYAMLVAIAAGHQAVLMAPTEVLASQHWATIDAALKESRVGRLLLTGRLTAAERKQALQNIAENNVQLIIGTQAVIQQDVTFNNLGLVVIDEQHKFGVAQRGHFSKEDQVPHVLVMTATPIPRSLSLTQFGDLDITTITELPPGRQTVVTSRVRSAAARKKVWGFLRKHLRTGRQLYVVCPRVEENDSDRATELAGSAESVFTELQQTELENFRVGLVHGRLNRDEKADVMQQFRDGELQVLVSTTVIEVGVDVSNATLMVIQQAERFGLAQLHQLRGRISRGSYQGYCFLFSEADSPEAMKRLSTMEQTSNGFKIAEVDFELRGPGDVLGTKQHGELPLRVANLQTDQELLIEARQVAFELVASNQFDQPEFRALKVRVLERFGKLMDLPQSG